MAFLRFYLYEIYLHLNDVDEDALEASIVDKKNDLGIDFINYEGDQIQLIQAKYIGKKNSLNESDIDKFLNLPKNLRKLEFIQNAHKELKTIIEDVNKIKNPSFNLIFLTTDYLSQDKINFYIGQERQNNVSLQILDNYHLREEFKRVDSISQLPPNEVKFELGNEDYKEMKALLNKEEGYPTLIMTLKGTKIQSLYKMYSEQLFNYNIRLWLGTKNIVNKSMINTIQNEPERFFYYNNGISAVCESYELDEEGKSPVVICKGFQIINGAQTVTTIAKQQNTNNLSKVKVLMRLIAAEHGKDTKAPTGLNENIVKNSNSQTVINPSDFRSNDDIQISIQHQIKKQGINFTLISPFKPIYYQRKRRVEKEKSTKTISMQDLGKSFYAYKYNPYELNASIKILWDISSTGVYYKVFGLDNEPMESITNEKLYEMLGVFFIHEFIKIKLKTVNKNENPSVLFKYHILHGIKTVLKLKYNDEQIMKILNKIVNEGIYINSKVNEKKEKEFSIIFERVYRNINNCISNIQNSGQIFVIRNFQRRKDFAEEIERQLKNLIIPSQDIPDLF